jgi:hypothetical protein
VNPGVRIASGLCLIEVFEVGGVYYETRVMENKVPDRFQFVVTSGDALFKVPWSIELKSVTTGGKAPRQGRAAH